MGDDGTRRLWNRKYEDGLPSLTKPDPFFVSAYAQFVAPAFPDAGTALDLAGGLGRHALWLASRRWRVSVVDVSEVALGELARVAARRMVAVRLVAGDAAEFRFDPDSFDLIVLFYHFDRTLFPKLIQALRPGGLVVCKLAARWAGGRRGDDDAAPLRRGEFPALVPGLDVLRHAERPVRGRGVVEFVGRK